MIMREIDATPRPFGLVVNSGLLPIRTGSTVAANDVVGAQTQPAAELLTINLVQWSGGLRGRASNTYTEDTATGQGLRHSPEHLGQLELSLAIWQNKRFASVELQAMSERLTVAGNAVGPVKLVNAALFNQMIVKGVDVSTIIYNLLAQHYRNPVSVELTKDSTEQDGRQFPIKATNKS
jgi:hypothetical protein